MTGALALEHIARRFGRVEALTDASLYVRPGTVHALLGENGAGKTTLLRIAFGLLQPDAGVIRVAGERCTLPSPADAMRRGIGMVHQHFGSVPTMTVAENVALGGSGPYRSQAAAARVGAIAGRLGFSLEPGERAGDLSVAAQQRLEIVRALAHDPSTLILDEPTAVLPPSDADELLAVLRRFAAAGGAVVLITHKLREALSAADDVTVLRAGRTVLADRVAAVDADALARAMIGGAPPTAAPRRARPNASGPVVLSAHDVVLQDARGVPRVKGVTLDVHAGEILGLAGVDGSGHHELLLALSGRLTPTSGALSIPGVVGFVPEDRHRDALILDFSITENVALRGAGRARGRLPWSSLRARAAALLGDYDIRPPQPDMPAGALSGGNQQKLVLGRELSATPKALVVENPTRGLDISASAAVRERLVAARDAGAAVVAYSSDLDEVLAMADRLIVTFAGRAREVPLDREVAGRAMLGLA